MRKVLVTGGGKGIGKAISMKLAERSWNVSICGRDSETMESSLQDFSNTRNHRAITTDFKTVDGIDLLVNNIDPLDGLVLNAGILSTKPIKFLNVQETLEVFQVNVLSNIQLLNNLVKAKKLNKGASVVFISSMATSKAIKGNSVYTASKAALNGFAKVTALELAKKGIRLNTVKPGFVETDLTSKLNGDYSKMSEHLKNYPLGRFGRGSDIANLVAFLLSEEAEWMTGTEINIDGGYSLS